VTEDGEDAAEEGHLFAVDDGFLGDQIFDQGLGRGQADGLHGWFLPGIRQPPET
jgi:hypothetical protein